MKKNNTLYVVLPCYNEEEVLEETTKRLKEKLILFLQKKMVCMQELI